MNRRERIARLTQMLSQVSDDGGIESLADASSPALTSGGDAAPAMTPRQVKDVQRSVKKASRDEDLSDAELHALEAIVMPRLRPVVFVENGTFGVLPDPWTHFGASEIRAKIEAALPAIGRIELPDNPLVPYGGTGFVVGNDLVMTNRHVAELFAQGLGAQRLKFRMGQTAAIDFKRERESDDDDRSAWIKVREVVMIHPFWDMAILRVERLPAGMRPLVLAIDRPEDLVQAEVAVIGYPARDSRNDLALQDRIFERTYNVKRLQPGKARERESIRSFTNAVDAMTHDSSTLGGNSGSAILDVKTGRIVGLHFAGVYLKANYAVPAFDLACDPRIVDAGLNFAGSVPPSSRYDSVWNRLGGDERALRPAAAKRSRSVPAPQRPSQNSTTFTLSVPLRISVSLGDGPVAADSMTVEPQSAGVEIPLQVPVIYPDLESRSGYDPNFLEAAEPVPLPDLTESGRIAAATLEDGSHVLHYHHFSLAVHKHRRLAIYTAANVDWTPESRLFDGRKPSRRELTGIPDGKGEEWVTDPRIPDAHQLPDVFYTKDRGSFDKGHLVRRDDVCWGDSFEDMQKGNGDTFHTTNCSPQIGAFNQGSRGRDNWGDLEDMIQRQTETERVAIFAGPVMADDDPVFKGRDRRGPAEVQIPQSYWKIVVAATDSGLGAFGFVLEQDLTNVSFELTVPDAWTPYMVRISDIKAMIGDLISLEWFEERDEYDSAVGESLQESVRQLQ